MASIRRAHAKNGRPNAKFHSSGGGSVAPVENNACKLASLNHFAECTKGRVFKIRFLRPVIKSLAAHCLLGLEYMEKECVCKKRPLVVYHSHSAALIASRGFILFMARKSEKPACCYCENVALFTGVINSREKRHFIKISEKRVFVMTMKYCKNIFTM